MKKVLIPLLVFVFLWAIAGLIMNRYPLFAQGEERENLWSFYHPFMSNQNEESDPLWVILHMDQDEKDEFDSHFAEAILLSSISDVSVEDGMVLLRELRQQLTEDFEYDESGYFSGGMMGQRTYLRSCHSNDGFSDTNFAWVYLHSDDEVRDDFDRALVIELQTLNFEELSQEELIEIIRSIEQSMVDTYYNNN